MYAVFTKEFEGIRATQNRVIAWNLDALAAYVNGVLFNRRRETEMCYMTSVENECNDIERFRKGHIDYYHEVESDVEVTLNAFKFWDGNDYRRDYVLTFNLEEDYFQVHVGPDTIAVEYSMIDERGRMYRVFKTLQ